MGKLAVQLRFGSLNTEHIRDLQKYSDHSPLFIVHSKPQIILPNWGSGDPWRVDFFVRNYPRNNITKWAKSVWALL